MRNLWRALRSMIQQFQPGARGRIEPSARPRVQALGWSICALWIVAELAFAALVPLALTKLGLAHGLSNELAAVGFDEERVQLLEFPIVCLLGGVVAGILLRRRALVWLGGLLYYVFSYLLPFIGQAKTPYSAPDGTAQALVPGAFGITIATLLAVGILSSGTGAVLGEAVGRVLISPVLVLGRFLLARINVRWGANITSHAARVALARLSVGAGLVIAIALAAENLGGMLNYGTTSALYQPIHIAALRGTVKQGTYPSPALGGRLRQYMIYLPPSYATSLRQRFPVIYLLHGNPGGISSWFGGAHVNSTADLLITSNKIRQTILVAPDGNGPIYQISEWANSFDGRQRMEESIAHDLVRYIDSHYRTLADRADRAIGGLSEGGYGAANIGLHHPDVFGTVLILSGFFQVARGPVFGGGASGDAYRRYNSPAYFVTTPQGVAAARMLTFIIGVGTHDYHYYPLAIAFYRELRRYEAHADLLLAPGGHAWQLWASLFAQALPIMEPPLTVVAAPRRSSG